MKQIRFDHKSRNIIITAIFLSILASVISGQITVRPNLDDIGQIKTLFPKQQIQDATYSVNSLDDDPDRAIGDGSCETMLGKCTLRAALQEAQYTVSTEADTVQISASGVMQIINGPLPQIVDNIKIIGPGSDQLTIDTQLRNRHFFIRNAGTLHLDGVTLSKGRAESNGNGGLLYNEGQLALQNVTLAGGRAYEGGAIYSAGQVELVGVVLTDNQSRFHGGAIYATGPESNLQINATTFQDNHATLGYGGAIYSSQETTVNINTTQIGFDQLPNSANRGAGIYNDNATLTLNASTIAYNSVAGNGSALYVTGNGIANLTNSTLSHNRADNDGGAIYLEDSGTITLNYTTITANLADADSNGSGDGGAVSYQLSAISYQRSATSYQQPTTNNQQPIVQFKNSIIAGNQDSGDEYPNCSIAANQPNPLQSAGFNIWESNTHCPVETDDLDLATSELTIEQVLRPVLENYGGPTQSHALVYGSPAIDKSDPTNCATISPFTSDQRNMSRPQGNHCDIGAVETALIDLSLTKSVDPAIVRPGQLLTYKLSIANNGPSQATNVIVTDTLPALVDVTSFSSADIFITQITPEATQSPNTDCQLSTINCQLSTNLAWSVGDLATGDSGVIIISGVVSETIERVGNYVGPSAGQAILNQATILADVAEVDTNPNNNNNDVIFHTPHRIHKLSLGQEELSASHALAVPLQSDFALHSTGEIATTPHPQRTFFVYGMSSGYYTFTTAAAECDTGCISTPEPKILQAVVPRAFHPGEKLWATVTADMLGAQSLPHIPHVWQFTAHAPYGTGNFNATAQLSLPPESTNIPLTSQQSAVGDLDSDGDLDIVLANRDQPQQIWLNDGSGYFTQTSELDSIIQSWAAVLGDLDADGDLDIFTAGNNPGGFGQANHIWFNDGQAKFFDSGQRLGLSNSRSVALGDLNGDGLLDAAVANTDGQPNTVWLNSQAANFRDSNQQLGQAYTNDVAIGDLDNDGDLDLFFANGRNLGRDLSAEAFEEDEATNTIWLNDGMGSFSLQPSAFSLQPSDSQSVDLGDVDGDGDLDALVTNASGQGNRLWINDGTASFSLHPSSFHLQPFDSRDGALGDLDGDGDLDALIVNYNQANRVWFNDGTGNFVQDGQQVGFFTSLGVTLGDLNGDSSLDALITTDGEENHLWYNAATADLTLTQQVYPSIVAPGDTVTYTIHFTNLGPGIANNVEIESVLPAMLIDLEYDSDIPLAVTDDTTYVWQLGALSAMTTGTLNISGRVDPTVQINTVLTNTATIRGTPEIIQENNQDQTPLKVGITSVQFTNSAYEIDENQETALLQIKLDKPNPFIDVEIAYQIIGGTAQPNIDYQQPITNHQSPITNHQLPTLTIPSGETEGTIQIPIINDTRDELDETLLIQLTQPNGAFLGAQANTTLTILDDDPEPTLTIQDVTVNEAERIALFQIQLSAPSDLPISVAYRTLEQSATTTNDYIATSGAINIPPGITHHNLIVTLLPDTLHEQDEQFVIALGNPSNAALHNNRATATIVDDDPQPILRAEDLKVDESAGIVLLDVHLSEVSGLDTEVAINHQLPTTGHQPPTTNHQLPTTNYQPPPTKLTIPAGETSVALPITIHDDDIYEPNEILLVELSEPKNAALVDSNGPTHLSQIEVIDNDEPPAVRFKKRMGVGDDLAYLYQVNEYHAQATLYVELGAPSGHPITVTYSTSDDSAISVGDDFDYTATTGTLTFEPGVTEQEFQVPIRNDSITEGLETVLVSLQPSSFSLQPSAPNPISLQIIDDDGPLPLIDFALDSYQVDEGSEAILTLQMVCGQLACEEAVAAQPIAIEYQIDDPLNLLAEPVPGTFTFTTNTPSHSLHLNTQDDTIYRGDSTITIALQDSDRAHIGSNSPVQLTIKDNDPLPVIAWDSPTYTFNEGRPAARITAYLQGETTKPATLFYHTQDETAYSLHMQEYDYAPTNGLLTFLPGMISQTVEIPLQDDKLDEPDETFHIHLTQPTNATLGELNRAALTIVDNDLQPTLDFSQLIYTVGESDGVAHLDVVLNAPSTLPITVNYVSSDESAIANQDYTPADSRLLFPPGTTRQSIPLPILPDEEIETDERFLVSLYGPVNANLGRNNPAAIQILDNDSILPRIQFDTPIYNIEEGRTKTVTVTLSMASNEVVEIDYRTADKSALATLNEYIPVQGTLVFTPGITSQSFTIATNDDLLDESNKEVSLILSNPIHAALGTNALATLLILDNEELPEVFFEQAEYTITEGTTATTTVPATITVALANTSNLTVTINYATVDDSAISGPEGDYLPASGELSFPPGTLRQTFVIAINADSENEPNEGLDLRLFNPSNAFLGEVNRARLIIEDSNFPTVAFAQPRYEVEESENFVEIDVILSSPSVNPVSIEYATSFGSATEITAFQEESDRDYEPTRGQLLFEPGETRKTFTVALLDDNVDERTESVSLVLFNPVRALLTEETETTLLVIDNDPQPEISFSSSDYWVNENGNRATIVVQLSAPSGLLITAEYVAENIVPTADQKTSELADSDDYQPRTGILRFDPGITSQTFTIQINDDELEESVEQAQLRLLNIQNATPQIDQAKLTIFDDENSTPGEVHDNESQVPIATQNPLRLTALEVTQGIQNLANTMPLVADRVTLARAYIQSEDEPAKGVSAYLRAFRNGEELQGSPIAANNNPITVQPDGGDRIDLDDSFWFYLPPAWRSGSVTLVTEVDEQVAGCALGRGGCRFNTTVTFQQGQPLRLRTVPVELYNAGNASTRLTYRLGDPLFGRLLDNLLRYHPVPSIDLYPAQTMDATTFASPYYSEWNLQDDENQLELLRTLWWTDLFTSGEPENMHWMGMLHSGIETGRQSAHSLGPGHDFWVKMDTENRIWPAWYLTGGSSMAYAVAYNRGAANILCVGNEKETDPNYPWSYAPPPNDRACSLAAVDPTGYYGLDVYHPSWGLSEPIVISNDPQASYGNRASPLMSDAHPQWISPYTYCRLLDSYGIPCDLCTIEPQSCSVNSEQGIVNSEERVVNSEQGIVNSEERVVNSEQGIVNSEESTTSRQPPATNNQLLTTNNQLPAINYQLEGPLLMVGGTVDFNNSQRTVLQEVYLFDDARNALLSDDKIWRLMQPALESSIGNRGPTYRLVQVDSEGNTLQSQMIKLRAVDHESRDTHLFFAAMLQMTGVDRVELWDENGNILDSRELTGQPPTVQLLGPLDGQLTAGTTVEWQASDPDEDALRFTLLYSPDDGTSWQTIALGLRERAYTLSEDIITHLAGSQQGKLQVVAHDGFYTARDSSAATLQLANKPPIGLLLWPAQEMQIKQGETVVLRGIGTDVEDGSLADEQLTWSSNRDGVLGSGTELAVDTLSSGNHLILLKVTDSAGEERQAFTTISVEAPPVEIYLPLIYR